MTIASKLSRADKRRYRHRSFDRMKRVYDLLIRLVGGTHPCCAWCGRNEHQTQLQLDHVEGKTWRANRLRWDDRIRRYRAEFLRGVPMRILCVECNSKDGRRRQIYDQIHGVWSGFESVRVVRTHWDVRIERVVQLPAVPF